MRLGRLGPLVLLWIGFLAVECVAQLGLKIGSDVVASLHEDLDDLYVGKITKVTDAYITLEIAANVEVTVQRLAVQTLLPKGTLKSL